MKAILSEDQLFFRDLIGRAILARIAGRLPPEVDIRIGDPFPLVQTGADFEQERIAAGAVLKMMPVRHACLEARAISGLQNLLAGIGDEHDLTFDYPNELVLSAMPVTLARPRARRKAQQIDAELGQAGRIAECLPQPVPARTIIGRRVLASSARRRSG